MRHLLALLFLSTAYTLAGEEWELYHAPGEQAAAAQVQPLLPQGVTLKLCELSSGTSPAELRRQARAIEAGVAVLPCLVIRDDRGPYAALPLVRLTAEHIAQARQSAHAPERAEAALRRSILARLYSLRAELSTHADEVQQDLVIARMRELMQAENTPQDMRQFIGLHGIYPALMQQYASAYQGAHTPRTEAKLLEAIRMLETVRDMDPRSTTGRQAYDEREKLRAARLKSRQYE